MDGQRWSAWKKAGSYPDYSEIYFWTKKSTTVTVINDDDKTDLGPGLLML